MAGSEFGVLYKQELDLQNPARLLHFPEKQGHAARMRHSVFCEQM